MKTLYLHLGFHKTATTSFQHTCAFNQELLINKGICYPVFTSKQVKRHRFINHSIPLHNIFCDFPERYHVNIKMGVTDYNAFKEEFRFQLGTFLETDNDIILSGEDVSTWQPDKLNQLATLAFEYGYLVRPIVLIRSPYEFHCSAKQQRIKGGHPEKLTDFRSQISKIKNIKSALPNTTFIPFKVACKHSYGPVGFLLEMLGIPLDDIKFKNKNESIENIITRAQNEINHIQPRIKDGMLNKKWIDLCNIRWGINKNKFVLSDTELKRLMPELKIENAKLKELLGKDFLDTSYKTALCSPYKINKVEELIQQLDSRLLKVKNLLFLAVTLKKTHFGEFYLIMKAVCLILSSSNIKKTTQYKLVSKVVIKGFVFRVLN